jgi:phosphate transport system permease protein
VSRKEFGVLPEIWGTLYSSLLALLLGGIFGIAIAIFLTQNFIHSRVAAVFRTIVELLAAIPSVVYGLWGIYVLIPLLRPVADWLHEYFDFIPLFSTELSGPGLAPAALVLGFGRALGETMALAILIGNSNQISMSLFAPADTLASLLASNFPEAGQLEVEALMYAALVLLTITLIVNLLGLGIQQYTMRKFEGKK